MKMADTTSEMVPMFHAFNMPARDPGAVCKDIASFLKTNPDAWCKNVIARAGDGAPLGNPDTPWARSWCAIGLIAHFVGRANTDLIDKIVERCSRVITPPRSEPVRLEMYNDQDATTREDIIAMFECAALLPRCFDEVKDPEVKQPEVKFSEMFSAPVMFGFGTAAATGLKIIETPPESKIEVPTTSMLTEAELTKVMDEIKEQEKKLVPWAKIMAQIKGESMAA
jgi:hypothetical protein